jgi:hypothetical protein
LMRIGWKRMRGLKLLTGLETFDGPGDF